MRSAAVTAIVAALLPIFVAASAAAQIFQRGVALAPAEIDLLDAAAATHLENARRFLAEKQWEEAVDAIRLAMEGDRGRYVQITAVDRSLPEGIERYVPVREYCQWRLAALAREAPEALAHYRSLADPLAEEWYQDAVKRHDEPLLVRLVGDSLATRPGDDALLWLGDAALARGDYSQARHLFSRIGPNLKVPAPAAERLGTYPGAPLWLALRDPRWPMLWPEIEPHWSAGSPRQEDAFPDSDLPAATVRARLVLASILEGSFERAQVELDFFRQLHGQDTGKLAGRDGNLGDLLAALLAEARSWPAAKRPANWLTFGGNSARTGVAAGNIDPAGQPLWSLPLPRLKSDLDVIGAGRLRVADDMKGLLAYHPLVVNDTVLLRVDARGKSYLTALDLRSGQRRWQVDAARIPGRLATPGDDDDRPWELSDAHDGLPRHVGVARYTLTVHGNKAFVRMGSPVTGPPARKLDQVVSAAQGYLMGYDLATEGKPLEGFPIRPESQEWSFEGTPLCDGQRLYVAMRRIEQGRCQMHAACFALTAGDAPVQDSTDDSRPIGRMMWRTKICSAGTLGFGDYDELSHQLLSLDGGLLFIHTNLGVVAAMEAATGQVQWLCKYPRAPFRSGDPEQHDDQFFRDLTPCMAVGDYVIVAPADCDRLLAFERATGALAWATEPGVAADAVHLLGSVGDWLIVSGNRLYWLDLHTGRVRARFPNSPSQGPMQAAANPRGFGRGLLAGTEIYWPTREHLLVFRQQPLATNAGYIPDPVREIPLLPRQASGGNLVFARGVLLIAAGDKLVAFEASAPEADAERP